MKINENGIARELTQDEIEKYEELDTVDNVIKIQALKEELAEYDYIGVKIAMGVATIEEYSKEIAYTEELRKKIRKLEASIDG